MSDPHVLSRTPITAREARELTDRINGAAGQLWRLLLESYEREAWRALGYGSWREYAQSEFTISQSTAYESLNRGRVIRAIAEAAGEDFSDTSEISVRDARALKPAIGIAQEEVRTRVDAGEDPDDVVPDVVERHRRKPDPKPVPAEDEGWGDPVHALEKQIEVLSNQNEELQRLVKSLETSDAGREITSLHAKHAQLSARLDLALKRGGEAERQATRYGQLLARIRKLLGVERNGEILHAVREFMP